MSKLKKLTGIGLLALSSVAFATNGDMLIGVGPVSRAMGGVGIGLVTDADSVVFSNPSLMTEFNKTVFSFGGTLFMPHTKAYTKSVLNGGQSASATSNAKYFAIPSIGIIYPINQKWVFGISAYGISGMGVDYRNTNVKCDPNSPGCYTNFQGMEMSPSVALKINDKFSVGAGLDLVYGALDLGAGLSSDYAVGFQVGAAYKYNKTINLGFVVKSPIRFNFARVADFNGDGTLDSMTLEQPWQVGVGIGVKPLEKFRFGADVVWVNWSDAKGYKDFHWKDQWVFKIGGEYSLNDRIKLRAGYNYGKSPVRGQTVPAVAQYEAMECLRIIGFPAIVEHHITVGAGFKLTQNLNLDLSYMHAFQNTVESTATNGDYWKSKLSEDAISMGLTWSF